MTDEDKVFTSAIKRHNSVKNNLYDLIPKEDDLKVFCSSIERVGIAKNNLYELIEVEPVKPLELNNEADEDINFNNDKDKFYVSKRYSKFTGVKTVNSIRSEFEREMCTDLFTDLEKQESFLLRKIRYGYSGDEKTMSVAGKILSSGRPINRSTLQMISNINPNKYPHSKQYVLFNGSFIRVSGSLGGNRKFICNFDLGKKNLNKTRRFARMQRNSDKMKLLMKSLSTKFKPGPLVKKSTLDESYQKYNVGITEIVKLPKIGLNVRPCLGSAIEPTITDILSIINKDSVFMSKSWAEYSVSTLFSNDKLENKGIVFPLPYKNNQKNIMMRRDSENITSIEISEGSVPKVHFDENTDEEVTKILRNMVDSVEISLNQDSMYTGEDDLRDDDTNIQPVHSESSQNTKRDKTKCSGFKELERLDVTVIRLADTEHESINCRKKYCIKGCVCASLNCESKFKDHCGRLGCMFECKCDFSKYKAVNCIGDIGVDGFLPGLYNLDTEINSKLAKEEKKFHQTIVVTDEKRIILKSHKRNLKTPKRYVEYFEGKEGAKRQANFNKMLSISVEKLPDINIEPWCMVHNLYKCFCKGIFTERAADIPIPENITTDHNEEQPKEEIKAKLREPSTRLRSSIEKPRRISSSSTPRLSVSESDTVEFYSINSTCARVSPFEGQKFDAHFYKETNKKIRLMEQNDERLKDKFIKLVNSSSDSEKSNSCVDVQSLENDILDSDNDTQKSVTSHSSEENSYLTPARKSKLIQWLNANYKHYKEMLAQGNKKIFLKPPQPGKLALYPWEVIRDRYIYKKNFFLVTKDLPYRLFMAVHRKHSFFKNCIPIDQIPFMELRKYPISVRNLIDGACYVSDNFYILGGLSLCWEIIGSVTKVSDRIPSPGESQRETMNFSFSGDRFIEGTLQPTSDNEYEKPKELKPSELNSTQQNSVSKWFVMTIANDFSEIQFYNKGFFVKFDIILRAIKVSRSTKKTVRLSSTKSNETDGPQFGIYAVPEMNVRCVFIGPYEIDEALGFGIIAKPSQYPIKKTKGYWITTEKVNNLKVIDDPLSFFHSYAGQVKSILHVESRLDSKTIETTLKDTSGHEEEEIKNENKGVSCTEQSEEKPVDSTGFYSEEIESSVKQYENKSVLNEEVPAKKPEIVQAVKVIKPITVKKSTSSLLNFNKFTKTITLVRNKVDPYCKTVPIIKDSFSLSSKDSERLFGDSAKATTSKPIAEIAPQIKQTVILKNEMKDQVIRLPTKTEGGMFILNPEEINKRVLGKQIAAAAAAEANDSMKTDIENFLATSQILARDVLEISDDEEEMPAPVPAEPEFKQVWIEHTTIENLGWIPGRMNKENQISFEFPGFKYTDFYPQEEALNKIAQVLSRKVYVPKFFPVKWRVVDSPDQLVSQKKLETSDLGPEFVLTKSGLKHKVELDNLKSHQRGKLLGIKSQVVTDT